MPEPVELKWEDGVIGEDGVEYVPGKTPTSVENGAPEDPTLEKEEPES